MIPAQHALLTAHSSQSQDAAVASLECSGTVESVTPVRRTRLLQKTLWSVHPALLTPPPHLKQGTVTVLLGTTWTINLAWSARKTLTVLREVSIAWNVRTTPPHPPAPLPATVLLDITSLALTARSAPLTPTSLTIPDLRVSLVRMNQIPLLDPLSVTVSVGSSSVRKGSVNLVRRGSSATLAARNAHPVRKTPHPSLVSRSAPVQLEASGTSL